MPDLNLSQVEADTLLGMEKHKTDNSTWQFPEPGAKVAIPLVSGDKREDFILDVYRGRINLLKVTHQNRARRAVVLMRLDIEGATHENPDGEKISCPHLHVYRAGYGVKWAVPAPPDRYKNAGNLRETLDAFMKHCNIVEPPIILMGLF